jgi:ParB/RepB/Spo0J family partition protein
MSTVTFRGIPTADLTDNPRNVRDDVKVTEIDDLAASIRANGILQPLIVNHTLDDQYVVTDGHRRLAAARLAKVPIVPCLVTDAHDDQAVLTVMLATAMHKELTPLEQAKAFEQCRKQGMLTPQIARATGYSPALVKNRLLLLELPAEAQDMVEADELTLGQATALAKQVKAKRTGTTTTSTYKSRWLARTHRLASKVELTCDHADVRQVVGGVGCGQCWEAAIREDQSRTTAQATA